MWKALLTGYEATAQWTLESATFLLQSSFVPEAKFVNLCIVGERVRSVEVTSFPVTSFGSVGVKNIARFLCKVAGCVPESNLVYSSIIRDGIPVGGR